MVGRSFSHYRILSELGSGGMGVVYLAEDLNLDRRVAIKFLPAHMNTDPEARRRFVHEAKAAAALDHSGICAVYEAGEDDGRPFIVMSYLEGLTLRDRIAKSPLPIPEALEIAAQVADALHEAHSRGVVHRDIKPANIMLTSKGPVKVMDFGLAQLAGASQLTKSGTTLGTAAYLSPEMARCEDADRRTDIWSLGVVLYEMVCGRRPFHGDNEAALMYGLLHTTQAPLTGLRTGVPMELDRIVGKCLAKDAGRRYQHADELAVDLRRMLSGLDETRTIPAVAPIRRTRRVPVRAAAWVLLLAVGAVGTAMVLRHGSGPSNAEAALAVMDFEDLGGTADSLSVAGLGGLLQVGLIERSPIRIVSPEYLLELRRQLFAGAQGAIKADQALAVARKSGASLLLSGQIGRRDGSPFVVWRLVETDGGRGVGGQRVARADLLGLADGIIAQVVPLIAERNRVTAPVDSGSVGRIMTASSEAYRIFVAGDVAMRGTNPDKEGALGHFQAAVRLDSTFARAWMRQAEVHLSSTHFIPARECANKAWDLRTRLGIKDRMKLESIRLQLAGNLAAAMDVHREMLVRWPDERETLRTYCETLFFWWLFPEAQEIAEQGLSHFPDDEDFGTLRCFSLVYRGRTAEARAAATDYQQRHPGTAAGWDMSGEARLAAGEADSAASDFMKARRLDPDDFKLQVDLARCAAVQGRASEAETIFGRLLARTDLSFTQRRRLMLGFNDEPGMAQLCAATGRLQQAMNWVDETHQFSDSEWSDMVAQRVRAIILLDSGRPRAALTVANSMTSAAWKTWAQALRLRALAHADSLPAAREALAEFLAVKDRGAMLARYLPLSVVAALSLAEGHPDSALSTLTNLEEFNRLWPPELENRARALRELGRLPEAAATLEGLLKRNGCRFVARYQLGRIYEEMGRKADAAREYEAFLKAWENADPGWPQVEDALRRMAVLKTGR